MTSWHVEGVGDIHTTTSLGPLIDVGGYVSVTPAEARALAMALLEAAADETVSHYTILGAYPSYTILRDGQPYDHATDMTQIMKGFIHRMNPGDSIVWADEQQEVAE